MYKTLNYWSTDMLNFDFSEKSLWIVSPPHCMSDFSRKRFLMLYFTKWSNFIVWLPLHFNILGNMCIAAVFYPDSDVIKFEINFIFIIKPFFYMTKKPRWKFKDLKNKESFWGEIISIFHQELSVVKGCVRPESASLIN